VKTVARSELRIQYSGLIIFTAQIISVATGMAFILLLTRNMTKPQYGVWSNIFDLTGYFLLNISLDLCHPLNGSSNMRSIAPSD
jgi:hypothetical protein